MCVRKRQRFQQGEEGLTEQGSKWACALAAALCAGALVAAIEPAPDKYRVSRVSLAPTAGGSLAVPKPLDVGFGLGISAGDRLQRPAPIKTYAIGVEGVLA